MHRSYRICTFSLMVFLLGLAHPAWAGEVAEHAQEAGGHINLYPLLFVMMALLLGAGTRHFMKKSPLPYTVSLLLIGLALGASNRLGWFGQVEFMHASLQWAGDIDPHLILYIFLPTLVFEAAFAMDLHTFRKSLSNAALLAIPGIIIALVLTALLVMGMHSMELGFTSWTLPMALLFGTVISATDPVAVVSLLKELGASKKLGTLIEGESLLNDGTAIVIFSVLLLGLTGGESPSGPVLEFLRVAVGGTLLGLIFGWIVVRWVGKVFNDALIEISLIIAAAYLTFFVAEHFLHVSGVLGLVALGLMIGGIGRTRISPEVEHFLHEFWEMAAFIANTLIFIIVGVVIASDISFVPADLLRLLVLYVGIHVVRALVIALFYPLMRRLGYGLAKKDAVVLWYGALRGAIGLALALMVAGEEAIPQGIRDEFLFYTAGIVTLTLLINATTIKYLVQGLGLTRPSAAKRMMMSQVKTHLRSNAQARMEQLRKDRYIKRANWESVKAYTAEKEDADPTASPALESTLAEARLRILEKEKSSYWSQFSRGMMSASAVRRMNETIQEILDEGGLVSLSERTDLEDEWHTPVVLKMMRAIPFLQRLSVKMFFERLSISYDMARGLVSAQESCLELLGELGSEQGEEKAFLDPEGIELLENEIQENRIQGHTYLRNLRIYYPEIYTAVATRQASRALLNEEKQSVKRMLDKGIIEVVEASRIEAGVEERMKRLLDAPPAMKLPTPVSMLKEIPWLADLQDQIFQKVVAAFQDRIYAVGDQLIKEHGAGDGVFVVVRGKVKILMGEEVVDVVGPGSVIGEMSVLTGQPRSASVVAVSPLTALWMGSKKLQALMAQSGELENRMWEFASMRFAMNLLGRAEPYKQWRQREFTQWLSAGRVCRPAEFTGMDLKQYMAILVTGEARSADGSQVVKATASLDRNDYHFTEESRIFIRHR